MGPVNWLAVVVAAVAAMAVALGWRRRIVRRADGAAVATALVMLLAAAMLGHALARIGPEKLAVKPWLYWMQSGGLAVAFVIPAVALAERRAGVPARAVALEACGWLLAYLAMGSVFFAFGGR